jgi:hypothetical protein
MRITLLLCLLINILTLRGEDVIDKISEASCECIKDIGDTLDMESYKLQLGLCIIKEAQPYKAELKKSYKIDLDKINNSGYKGGETLGEMVGVKLITYCPEEVQRMARIINRIEEGRPAQTEPGGVNKLAGKVTDVEKNQFITLFVEEENGKISKALWLQYFTNSNMLQQNLDQLIGKHIILEYSGEEIFDHRVGEYVSYKVIKNLVSLGE